jgi:hypothetical protein
MLLVVLAAMWGLFHRQYREAKYLVRGDTSSLLREEKSRFAQRSE